MSDETSSHRLWLQQPINETNEHILGNRNNPNSVEVVLYGDFLCPYCRQLRPVFLQLRDALVSRLGKAAYLEVAAAIAHEHERTRLYLALGIRPAKFAAAQACRIPPATP